jgi:P27 family predicted phage terminase small subunit
MPAMVANNPVARQEWLDIVPELLALGVLFPVDRTLLTMYCIAYSIWVQAKDEVAELGVFVMEPIVDRNGKVTGTRRRRNPAVNVMKEQQKLCNNFLLEYGLSFAARRRMRIDTAPQEVDPFDAYLARGQAPARSDAEKLN